MKFLPLVIFLILFIQCEDRTVEADDLAQIASDFNKKGPRQIDSETMIENIRIKENNTIVYNYTLLNLLVKNVDTNAFKAALRPGIISVIKVSPEMKTLRDRATNFEYCYSDKNHQIVYNFKIYPRDYR
jgi:predicted nucleic-acid-binding protein